MQKICYRNKGGIGNQLFIYFTAKSMSLKLNSSLIVDNITGFQNDFYKRLPSINSVVNDVPVDSTKFINLLFRVNKLIPNFILNLFGIYTVIESNNRELVRLDYQKLKKHPLILIEGYFQSYAYFEEYREEFLKSVFINFKINKDYIDFHNSIVICNSIAIHVRRVQYDNLLSLDYYLRAIDYILSEVDNPHFFIFSDDTEWCKNNLKLEFSTIIEVEDSNEIQELFLMTQCKNHIIANSSFSWWGAWLSKSEENEVVAPRNIQIGVIDLFLPANWKLL